MSIENDFAVALLAALIDEPALAATINRFGDSAFEAGPDPALWLTDVIGSEWGAKDRPGRELRCGITISDFGPVERIATLTHAAENAALSLPRSIAGWECGGTVITRARMARARDGQRIASIDMRARLWRAPQA